MDVPPLCPYLPLASSRGLHDSEYVSEEKLVRFAMSFMAKDTAAQWAKCRSAIIPFLFPTWAEFATEFHLWFIEKNK
jgi:hypothetical protein